MAKAKPATGVSTFCGSLGATTAHKAPGTPRLRLRWPIATRNIIIDNGKFRIGARVKNLAAMFRLLDAPTLAAWEAFATTADPITNCPGFSSQPNLWQAFLAANLKLLQNGQPTITTPPTSATPTVLTSASWSLHASPAALVLNSVSPAIASDEQLLINASGKMKHGSTAFPSHAPYLISGPPGVSAGITFTAEWLAKHGTLSTGVNIAVEVRCLNIPAAKYSPGLKSVQPVL